jgi:2',3'-cyclic-nucleotide 2'-phosphodiesterase (5'-nucleotidase family)
MEKIRSIASLLILLFLINACAEKQYAIKSINGYLVEMDSRFDNRSNPGMLSLVESYRSKLEAEMNEEVGYASENLTKTGTQSALANFTASAMLEYASGFWDAIDFAVINNGGLRTTLNQGAITTGNLYEIYAFENNLVLLELPGKAVAQLFDVFTRRIAGISEGVRITISNNAIESLTFGGQPLDETATYRVVTVDYLAEGNDGMEALTQATDYTDSHITLRDAMIEYIKKLTAENRTIHAAQDIRIEIKE